MLDIWFKQWVDYQIFLLVSVSAPIPIYLRLASISWSYWPCSYISLAPVFTVTVCHILFRGCFYSKCVHFRTASSCGNLSVKAIHCKTSSWLHFYACTYITQTYERTHKHFMDIRVDMSCMDSYCMDAHSNTFQTDSSANDVFALSSSCPLSVTVPGVSTTTTSPCWRPPEPSRACRSSRKCRSLRKPQQWRLSIQSSKQSSRRSHCVAFIITLKLGYALSWKGQKYTLLLQLISPAFCPKPHPPDK